MRNVRLRAGGWETAVARAESFAERLSGVKALPASHGLMLSGSSIHTFGLGRSIEVFGILEGGLTTRARTVPPGRIAWFRGASHVVELPAGSATPPEGILMEILDE